MLPVRSGNEVQMMVWFAESWSPRCPERSGPLNSNDLGQFCDLDPPAGDAATVLTTTDNPSRVRKGGQLRS